MRRLRLTAAATSSFVKTYLLSTGLCISRPEDKLVCVCVCVCVEPVLAVFANELGSIMTAGLCACVRVCVCFFSVCVEIDR